jgi:hypothetical protein
LRDCGMVKQVASLRVVSFVMLAACGAVCQNVRHSLPDTPSVQAATPEHNFNGFVEEARSPFRFNAPAGNAGPTHQLVFADPDKALSSQREPDAVFRKYLYPSSPKQQWGYHPVNNGSLMGRATSAASRQLITRDDSGKARLNTSYLLRTLTAIAKDTASTPYWRRSLGAPLGDFGSTVGNDAGMNLWREFAPGIQQLMKSHTPKFVSRIEERVTHH